MAAVLSEISSKLDVSEKRLIEEGLKVWLEREIKLAREDIETLKDRYRVSSRGELEEKIRNKEIYSHPAWEDLITWENLDERMEKLKGFLEKVG